LPSKGGNKRKSDPNDVRSGIVSKADKEICDEHASRDAKYSEKSGFEYIRCRISWSLPIQQGSQQVPKSSEAQNQEDRRD